MARLSPAREMTVPTGSVGPVIDLVNIMTFAGSKTTMKTPTTRRINPKATMRSANSIVYREEKKPVP